MNIDPTRQNRNNPVKRNRKSSMVPYRERKTQSDSTSTVAVNNTKILRHCASIASLGM